ncbi:MAG TPA: EAL domain-containing protein, partial [Casimicrobiaceae bacterium]
ATARKSIGEDLVAGARVFERVREQDRDRLIQAARLLSATAAFRQAIAPRDKSDVTPVLTRYGRQIDAELIMLIRADDIVVADTTGIGSGEPFFFPKLIAQARAAGQVSATVVLRGRLYQLVIVPMAPPSPIAWIVVGYPVNDVFAREISRLLRLEVSFLSRIPGNEWKLQATTLSEDQRASMLRDVSAGNYAWRDDDGNAMFGPDAITRITTLPAHTDDTVAVVLQQPLSTAMEPFRKLQRKLAWISLLAAVVAIVASILIARGIAEPVRSLAAFARRMATGEFETVPLSSRNDEIGDLANAFRAMQEGMASREERITNLAYRDTLTGLANRTLFADRADHALATAARERSNVAVLLMDIDHFKYVNDTLGHAIGDLLLLEVATRIQGVVKRRSDTIARLGGDEFALLLPGTNGGDAQRVADTILRTLETPMTLDGHQVDVRASIGIAVFPDHGNERSTLVRHADVAMYAAKRNNLGALLWDDRYDQHSRERLSLMGDLRKAVDSDELALLYQPKVALRHSNEHYVEALVRWQHPARGLVPPAEFIPFAEQTGYIRHITKWVMARAIAQCAAWRRDGLPMNVSINISARDLVDVRLPEQFAALLQAHGCVADWITFEITESAILDDPGNAVDNLGRLRTLGCRLAIDDYGTGYSSLAYLRKLPVDELKIDKSFVLNMARDASDMMIVRSTIELAHNMGLTVVAEGVDDEGALDRLRALGCDMVQGFLLSRPLTAEEIAARLASHAQSRVAAIGGLRLAV